MADMESKLNRSDQERESRREDYQRFENHILRIEQALGKQNAVPQAPAAPPAPQVAAPAPAPVAAETLDIPQFVKSAPRIEEFRRSRGEQSKSGVELVTFVPGSKSSVSTSKGKLHEDVSLSDLDVDFGPFVPGQKAKLRPKPVPTMHPVARPKSAGFSLPPFRETKASMWTSTGAPILTSISKDYLTMVLVMRWIEFLFERVTRKNFIAILDYYREIGWITEEVEKEIISLARGEMQDVTKIMAREEEAVTEEIEETGVEQTYSYKKVDDWRLSADDHLKSLLFVMKIAGYEIDRDRLNSLEHMIEKFTENLENFHAI